MSAGKRKPKAPAGCYWRGNVLWGRIKVRGRTVRWSLETDNPAIAKTRREAGKQRLIAARHGEVDRSFEEVFAAWDRQIETTISPGAADRYRCSLEQIAPWLEGRTEDEINGELISEIIEARQAAGVVNATIKRDMVALSSVLKFSMLKGWRDDNPVLAKLALIPERRDPILLPLDRDIALICERAPGMVAAMVTAALKTGAREAELIHAARDHIDHARRQLVIVGKRRKLRTIDLDPFGSYAFLVGLPAYAGKTNLFWHDEGEAYSTKAFAGNFHRLVDQTAAWAKEAGVPFQRFRFHDLRHRHAVDFLKDSHGTIYDLQGRLGHSSVKTTEIYLDYLTPAEAQSAKFGAPKVSQKGAQRRAGGTAT